MKPEQKAMPVKKLKKVKVVKKKENSRLIIGIVAVLLLAAIAYAVLSEDSTPTAKKSVTLKEVRDIIDDKYGKGRMGTNTPPTREDYKHIFSPKVAGKLPSYAYTNPMTLKAYKYATEHPEVAEQMPCYCGCGEHGSTTSEGRSHRFLRDCFINDRGEYDDHASFCDVCIGEAITAQEYLPDGLSAKTIASSIPKATAVQTTP